MILYLNNDVFENGAKELTCVLRYARDEGIEILILMYELVDLERGGCEFDNFNRAVGGAIYHLLEDCDHSSWVCGLSKS